MRTPEIHSLCGRGDLNEIKQLVIEGKGDLSVVDKRNRNVLHLACKKGFGEIVEFVLANGGSGFIDDQDDDGKTALYEACCRGHVDVVEILLSHGAYINVISSSGNVRASKARQALRGACKYKQLDVVQILVEGGADINVKSNAGETVLYESVRDGLTDIVSYLLEMGADLTIPNNRGMLPLHVAIREKHLNVVCLLLGNRADANIKVAGQTWTPLHIAASVDHLGIAEALLRYDAFVDAQNLDGQTALYMACRQGYSGMVDLLLYYGASPNLRSEGGYAPLHAASWEGHLSTVESLLQSESIDLEAKTNFAQTAYNIACERCHYDIAELLHSASMRTSLPPTPRTISPVSPVPPSPSPPPKPKPAPPTITTMKTKPAIPRRLKPTREAEEKTIDRLEKERRVKSEMVTHLSNQPSVVNRWEKVLINLGLERKKVDLLKADKLDSNERLNKGLGLWLSGQDESASLDEIMAQVANVLKNNNIGLNTSAGTFERAYKKQKKKYELR